MFNWSTNIWKGHSPPPPSSDSSDWAMRPDLIHLRLNDGDLSPKRNHHFTTSKLDIPIRQWVSPSVFKPRIILCLVTAPWIYGYQKTTVLLFFAATKDKFYPFLKKLFLSRTSHTYHHIIPAGLFNRHKNICASKWLGCESDPLLYVGS